MKTKVGDMQTVANLSDELQLITDSQDVQAVKEHIGKIDPYCCINDYDAFFVRAQNGEFIEVWGMIGTIPYLSKLVSRLV